MKLGRKDYTISVKTGTDANKAKFKKECVQGEIYHATDTGFFYIAEVTAGASDATLSKFGAPPFANQYSVSLDGSDDYMDIPDSTALETTAFTWSAWFYCTAISRHNPIVDVATSGATFNGYHIRVNTTNKIRFASYSVDATLNSTTVISANTWYHVAATHEAGSDKLYINGSLEASNSAPSFSISDAASLRVGSSQLLNMYHQGLIDEVSFFNSALSASNITSIYNSGVPNDISSLNPVGWWRMGDNDGGTGTTITNQGSASSIDGTLTNGPTFSTTVPS